jgi:ribonuclease P protein component
MLPRHHRLRANADFRRVYREGRSWAHPLMALHALPQPDEQRVGISVSKKVGGAVDRNRVRRRLREAVRMRIAGWKFGFDLVLVVRAAAAQAAYPALDEALGELARRARLVRDPEAAADVRYQLPPRQAAHAR